MFVEPAANYGMDFSNVGFEHLVPETIEEVKIICGLYARYPYKDSQVCGGDCGDHDDVMKLLTKISSEKLSFEEVKDIFRYSSILVSNRMCCLQGCLRFLGLLVSYNI
jgi:hypothetical protein